MGTVLLLLAGLLTMPGTAQADLTLIDADGIAAATSPSVNGNVHAIAPDGTGGMYIGGSFTTVNGAVRPGLAHIDSAGALGSWNPATPNGTITHLAVLGGSVYATGSFTSVGGVARGGTAAFSSSGALLPWNPGGGGPLVSDGTNLYVGGGTVRAVNSSGTTLWTQNVAATAMAVSGASLYIAGSFTSVATGASTNATRAGVAALSTATGYATTWAPAPDGAVTAIAVRGGAVHLGGSFTVIGTTTRLRLAAVDATGALLPWNPAITSATSNLIGLTAIPNGVVVTGSFSEIAGTRRGNFAVIDSDGAITTPAAYASGAATLTATAVGGRLAIGSWSGSTVQTRPDSPTIASITVSGPNAVFRVTGAARSGNQSPRFLVTCSGPGGLTTGSGSNGFPVPITLQPGTHSCVAVQTSESSTGLADSTASAARDVTVTGFTTPTGPSQASFELILTILGKGSLEISRCTKHRDPSTCDAVRTCTSTCTHTFESASARTYWILRAVPRPGFAVTSLGFFSARGGANAVAAPPRRRSSCPWHPAMTGGDPLSCFVEHRALFREALRGRQRFAVAFEALAKAFDKPSSIATFGTHSPGVSTLGWTVTIQSFAIPLVRTIAASCVSASGSRTTRTVAFRKPTRGLLASGNVNVPITFGDLSAGTTYTCLFNVKAAGLRDVVFKTTTGTLGGSSSGSSGGGSGGGSAGGGSAPVRPVIGPIVL